MILIPTAIFLIIARALLRKTAAGIKTLDAHKRDFDSCGIARALLRKTAAGIKTLDTHNLIPADVFPIPARALLRKTAAGIKTLDAHKRDFDSCGRFSNNCTCIS